MSTSRATLAWSFVLVASTLGSFANAMTDEECQRRGITTCDHQVAPTALVPPPQAFSVLQQLPEQHRAAVNSVYKLLTDPSGGSGVLLDLRRGDVARRLSYLIWGDYVEKRKISAKINGTDKEVELEGVSRFIGSPVAWQSNQKFTSQGKNLDQNGFRQADENAIKGWISALAPDQPDPNTTDWKNIAILYYVLGACSGADSTCKEPAWTKQDDLQEKMKAAAGAFSERLLTELNRYTLPSPSEQKEEALPEVRPEGQSAKDDQARRAYDFDPVWVKKFVEDAAGAAFKLITSENKGPGVVQTLRQTPFMTVAPGPPQRDDQTKTISTREGGTYTVDRDEAMGYCKDRLGEPDCGGKVAYLYSENGVDHPLSIRVIRVRDDATHKDTDYLQFVDMAKYAENTNRYHLTPVGQSIDEWDMPTSNGTVHHYRMETRPGPDGRQWIYITDGHGESGPLSMAPSNENIDSFGAVGKDSPKDDAFCQGTLRSRQVDMNRCRYAVTFESLVHARARQCEAGGRIIQKPKMGSYDYCVVVQLSPRLCYQFIRMEGKSATPDCATPDKNNKCGVACVKEKVVGGEYANLRDKDGHAYTGPFYIGTFENTPYCLMPGKADFDFDITTSNCNDAVDPPLNPPKPKDPKDKGTEDKGTTNPTSPATTKKEGEENPQLTTDPQKYLEAIKEQFGAVIGTDSTGKHDIAYFQTGKNANGPYFFLLYPNKSENKAISFSGVLLCQSSALCIDEQKDELLVRTADIPKDKLDGGDMRWLDLSQKDAEGNIKAQNGKSYPINNTTVFHIPTSGLKSLVSNPRKPTPGSSVSSWEDNEQTPTVQSGTFRLHVKWEDWKDKLQKLWDTDGNDSDFFGPTQTANRQMVANFIQQEIAKDKQAGVKDEWDPFVEIKMFTKAPDKDYVVEYTGKGVKSGTGKHPCKLWWKYTGKSNEGKRLGELTEECQ